jgi:hypothetical protein
MTADTVYIAIAVNPIPSVTLHRNKDTLCSGTPLILYGTGASSYLWTYGTSSDSTDTVKLNPTSAQTYNLRGISASCTSAVISFTSRINALPIVNYTLEIGDFRPTTFFACKDVDFQIRATGALNYSWTGPVTPSAGSLVTGRISATTPIQVTGTDANGCQGVRSRNIIMNATYNPVQVIWKTDSVFCRGDSGRVEVAGGNSDLIWSPTTGLSYVFTNNVIVKPTTTTTYTIAGFFLGCITSKSFNVNINQPPAISLSQSSGGRALCRDEADTITINSPGILFDWGVGVLSPEKVKTVMPGKTSVFTITAFDAIGCGNTASITVNVDPTCGAPLGVSTVSEKVFVMKVLGGSTLQFESTAEVLEPLNVMVINPTGATVADMAAPAGDQIVRMSLSHLPAGVYVVVARHGQHTLTRKIFIQ